LEGLVGEELGGRAGLGGPEFVAGLVGEFDHALDGLTPGVEGEVEESPVDWHEKAGCAEFLEGLGCAVGAHVDGFPVFVVGSNFEHGQVKGTVLFADFSEARPEAGVGSVIDVVVVSLKNIGSP
jgi:hypothetical protein